MEEAYKFTLAVNVHAVPVQDPKHGSVDVPVANVSTGKTAKTLIY